MQKMLSKTTSSGDTAFPWKLHMVLEQSTCQGFDEIISWVGNNAFKVHDPARFEEEIMQRFFNQTQYKSFQRQLNIYGFTRNKSAGKAVGSYTHPLFIRGNPDACAYMVRVKVKKRGMRKNVSNTSIDKAILKKNSKQTHQGSVKPLTNEPFSLHKRFVSFGNGSSMNQNNYDDIIEPTPLRSVSPSSASMITNDMIEPIPLPLISPENGRETSGVNRIVSNHDIVPCKRVFCDSGRSYSSMQPNYLRRNASFSLDLDLDTIFDDETNNGNLTNFSNVNANNVNSSLPFDHHFQMVEETSSGGVFGNRMVGIY